ncbi:MAG: siderophore-interacting protein [Solirubrobacteraceae bacterium]|jgi:NADPH-dependent ferric siderophore reductase
MPERRLLRTTVTDVTWLTPAMVRIVVGGPDLADFSAGRFSDEYVKCRFGDRTRSYTVRDWDADARLLTLDFVVHGDRGVAGPWAAAARPGDTLELTGPGGSYAPSADADWHLMSGDDAVIPAIAASLRRVRPGVPVFVVLEVDGTEHEHPLESPGDLQVTWIHRRAGAGEDASLQAAAVRRLFLPAGRGQAFVHGEATAVRLVRRHLLERGLPIDALSATGYWKLRRTDEQWRAEKPEWKRDADADAAQLRAAG